MQETDYVILFRILAFIIEGIKQRCNMIKFSFENMKLTALNVEACC